MSSRCLRLPVDNWIKIKDKSNTVIIHESSNTALIKRADIDTKPINNNNQ